MIYSSSSVILDLGKQQAWDLVSSAVRNLQDYTNDINSITQLEEYYDGYLRSVVYKDDLIVQERVFFIKDAARVLIRLDDHPLYKGEMVLQIISVDDEFLTDKKSTLTCVLSWRIHPGLIEAPMLDKQDYIEQILQNIEQKTKVSY